jgi:hypothetical protein
MDSSLENFAWGWGPFLGQTWGWDLGETRGREKVGRKLSSQKQNYNINSLISKNLKCDNEIY